MKIGAGGGEGENRGTGWLASRAAFSNGFLRMETLHKARERGAQLGTLSLQSSDRTQS